jgi:hypothetical protein
MKPNQLGRFSEEVKRGHKFLRGCKYDAKTKRLELRLGANAYEGSTKSVIVQAATEPPGLAKCIGGEIYGVGIYHHLHRTEVRLNLGQTITFDVQDEPETEPDRKAPGA